MIESPTENIKLTFEQMQQIDATNKQLAVLQSEITNANKILKGIKLEIDRATKEKEYQEELLATTSVKVEKVQEQLKDLNNQLKTSKENLTVTNNEIQFIRENHKTIADELSKRDKEIQKAHAEHVRQVEDFKIKSSQLLADQLAIKTAKDAFLKATEAVVW